MADCDAHLDSTPIVTKNAVSTMAISALTAAHRSHCRVILAANRELVPTVFLHIDDAEGAAPYPVRLLFDDEQPNGDAAPLATGTLTRDLALSAPPPHPDGRSEPYTVVDAVTWFLSQADPTLEDAEFVGGLLFRLLDESGISAEWRVLRERAWAERLGGAVWRTVLAVHPQALRALPWELVHHKNRFFHTESLGPWYRASEAPSRPLTPIARPVRLLVIVGCREDDDKVKWRQEVEAIYEVTCLKRTLFDVEILERPSAAKLVEVLTEFEPHILHFVGHGTPATRGEKAALKMWDDKKGEGNKGADDKGEGWSWTSTEINQRLQMAPPRLAVINACRSTAFAGEEGGWRIADALLEAGVAAVIGMQGDIEGEAASHFASHLYSQLAAGALIDRAMASARLETFQLPSVKGRRDWVLPTLTLSCAPESLLELEAGMYDAVAPLVATSDVLRQLRAFVGRRRERRQIRGHSAAKHAELLLLSGGKAIGKSDFLKTCLEEFALRGSRVVYVDLATNTKHDAIAMLRAIRGPNAPTKIDLLRPDLSAAFADFNEELNALLDGKPVPSELQRTPESGTDAGVAYDPNRAHPETLTRAFASFNRALTTSAGAQPLFIVIDHLVDEKGGMLPDEFTRYVRPLFLDAVMRHELPDVHLVLAVRDDQAIQLGLVDLLAGDCGRTLKPFPRRQWRWLANEYLQAKKLDRAAARASIAHLEATLKTDFEPRLLSLLAELMTLEGVGR